MASPTDTGRALACCLVAALCASACSTDSTKQQNAAEVERVLAERAAEQQRPDPLAGVRKLEDTTEVEVFGDPKIFDGPRIQFVASFADDRARIYSAKLDGSDVRRVMPDALFCKLGCALLHTPKRSPDGRYLAAYHQAGVDDEGKPDDRSYKALYDLKEGTVKRIVRSHLMPAFAWHADSKRLVYSDDRGTSTHTYHVETGEITDEKFIGNVGALFILDDGNILAPEREAYALYSAQHELLKRYPLPALPNVAINLIGAASRDGKLVTIGYGAGAAEFTVAVVRVDAMATPVLSLGDSTTAPVFDKTGKSVFAQVAPTADIPSAQLVELDLSTGKRRTVFAGFATHLQLVHE